MQAVIHAEFLIAEKPTRIATEPKKACSIKDTGKHLLAITKLLCNKDVKKKDEIFNLWSYPTKRKLLETMVTDTTVFVGYWNRAQLLLWERLLRLFWKEELNI